MTTQRWYTRRQPVGLAQNARQAELKPTKTRGWSPDDYLGWGVGLSVLGGIAAAVLYDAGGAFFGILIVVVASIMLSIGIIAKGVQVGRRWP